MPRLLFACLFLCFGWPIAEAGEIGPDDFRISQVVADRDFDATAPAIAHNPDDDEYLLVWRADDDGLGLVNDHFEVWGQRVSPGLALLGDRFRISTTGVDIQASFAVNNPEVAYNSTEGEFFVVWEGELGSGEQEIFGQRVDAATGSLLGGNIQVSAQGLNGSLNYEAFDPDIAYSSTQNEYFVVWSGDATSIVIFDDDFEIFGQRVSGTGSLVGAALQISTTGPANDPDYGAFQPAVTYDRNRDDYMIVWSADVVGAGVQWEIYARRINASDGVDVGFQRWMSDASTSGNDLHPDVAYAPALQEFLVVWSSDEDAAAGPEIYAQRFDVPTGIQVGSDDFRVSFMGPESTGDFVAQTPAVVWCPDQSRYLLSWSGVDETAAGFEIYGQFLDGAGAPAGPAGLRLSDMGPDGGSFEARAPSIAYRPGLLAAVWHGDDDTGELVEEEFEIHGQTIDSAAAAEVAGDVLLTRMGLEHFLEVHTGDVAYNPNAKEYLVVWLGEKAMEPLEFGVFVRRVDAATGAVLDPEDIRIDEDSSSYPCSPSAAYNPTTDEYLVVWGDGASRLWGQRLIASTLAETGTNDMLLSTPFQLSNSNPLEPDLLYCATPDRYVVVWAEDRLSGNEVELFMQQLDATGASQFTVPFRITTVDPLLWPFFEPAMVDMAYNAAANEVMLVFAGFGAGSSRIFLQRYDLDINDVVGPMEMISQRITVPGPFDFAPSIAFNSAAQEYLVSWYGTTTSGSGAFLQKLNATGAELGTDDFLLSDPLVFVEGSHVAYSPSWNEYLVTWGQSTGGGNDLAARRIGANGVPLADAFFLNETGGSVSANVSGGQIAFATNADNYLAVWGGVDEAEPFEMMGREVRGQLYEADPTTAAPRPPESVLGPRISTAYPNPFSTRMQFEVELDRTRYLRLHVYDVRGRRVAHVFEGRLEGPRVHSFTLSDRSLASGIYWIRLTGQGVDRAHRVTLLR